MHLKLTDTALNLYTLNDSIQRVQATSENNYSITVYLDPVYTILNKVTSKAADRLYEAGKTRYQMDAYLRDRFLPTDRVSVSMNKLQLTLQDVAQVLKAVETQVTRAVQWTTGRQLEGLPFNVLFEDMQQISGRTAQVLEITPKMQAFIRRASSRVKSKLSSTASDMLSEKIGFKLELGGLSSKAFKPFDDAIVELNTQISRKEHDFLIDIRTSLVDTIATKTIAYALLTVVGVFSLTDRVNMGLLSCLIGEFGASATWAIIGYGSLMLTVYSFGKDIGLHGEHRKANKELFAPIADLEMKLSSELIQQMQMGLQSVNLFGEQRLLKELVGEFRQDFKDVFSQKPVAQSMNRESAMITLDTPADALLASVLSSGVTLVMAPTLLKAVLSIFLNETAAETITSTVKWLSFFGANAYCYNKSLECRAQKIPETKLLFSPEGHFEDDPVRSERQELIKKIN